MKRINKIIIAIILMAVLLLGVGYSAIQNITLDITGTVTAEAASTLALATNANIGDYIDLGNNIVGTEETSDDWRILYVEGDTVYAILADYLPNSTNYAANAGLNTYSTYGVYSSTDRDTLLSGLTTTSNWNGLANGISGATVTGSPTAELLMQSYNTKNGTSLDYTTSPALDDETEDHDLYVPHTDGIDQCYGYWLASPHEKIAYSVWCVIYNGRVSFDIYNDGRQLWRSSRSCSTI